jgi:hypothetical protein
MLALPFGFMLGGCFSAVNPDASSGDTETSGDDANETGSSDPSTTSPSTSGSTTSNGGGSTTEDSSADDDPSADDDSSGDGSTTESRPDPYCGDGNVDEGEECDDGDINGSGQACLEDCTLNVCGDVDHGPDEACDDGDDNALELGACAPDCSRIIEAKQIELSTLIDNGQFGANPVTFADGHCAAGYKAMFAAGQAQSRDDLSVRIERSRRLGSAAIYGLHLQR